MLVVEHDFELPKGYVDPEGQLHRNGVMRLATAADEIQPMRDPRVQGHPEYLSVLLLSRVVTMLGKLDEVNAGTIERLFVEDLAFLQDMYNRINGQCPKTLSLKCPECAHTFEVELPALGGS